MTPSPPNTQLATRLTPREARRLTIIGAVFAVIGAVAILLPNIATLAGELLVAWMFTLWGAVGLWFAWEMRHAPEWRYAAIGFAVMLVAGLVFALLPAVGIATLTILMMVFLLMEGVLSVLFGFRNGARLPNGGWLIFSGLCSLVVGLIILFGWPGTATWTLGLLMGVNFLSTGISLIMLSKTLRTATGTQTDTVTDSHDQTP